MHQDGEWIAAAVGFVDLSDLHCVVPQVELDGNGSGVREQSVCIIQQGKETQHLNEKRLKH